MTTVSPRISDPDPQGVPIILEEGWEPSLDAPLPTMRCVAVVGDNYERCGKWSVRGLSTCTIHSGYEQFPSVRIYSEAVVESARLRLMGMTDTALDALQELLGPDTRQNVRLRAVEVTLDRAGVTPAPQEQKINLTVNQADPTKILTERLERLAAASTGSFSSIGGVAESDQFPSGGETIEGELVEDTETGTEQDHLF
jgi:hypothetical protein